MNSCTWRQSSPARAVAHVLETLLPGRVTRKVAGEPAEIVVYSYSEDFDELWQFPDSLLDWLTRGSSRHVVVVWGESRDSGRSSADDPSEHLPAFDWAIAATLVASQASWRISVLDLAPRHHAERATELGASLPDQNLQGHLPHLSVVQPWGLRHFFRDVMSGEGPTMPVLGAYARLEDLWCLRHERASQNRPSNIETFRRAPLAAYKKALVRENARFRHGGGNGFGAFLPAVRILLGAMQAETIAAGEGRDILRQIRNRQPTAPPETEYDFELLHRYVDLRQRVGDFGDVHAPAGSERPPARRKLLLIDDEHDTSGWDLVLPPLFRAWSVEAVGPTALAEKLETESALAEFNLVLLDFRLGKASPMNGLDFLAMIRSVNPFIPVVLFTMEDDSNLFSAAVEAGATGYFAKELADTADRNSVAYFEFLRRTIQSFEQVSIDGPRLALGMWNRLEAVHNRLSWSMSSLDEDEGLVFQGVAAIARALFFWAHGMELAEVTRREAHRAIGIDLGQCIAVLDDLGGTSRLKATRKFANSCKHGEAVQARTDAEIASLLGVTIDALTRQEKVKKLLEDRREPDTALTRRYPVRDYQSSLEKGRRTHTERAIWGAIRFVLGYYSVRNGSGDEFRDQFDLAILDVIEFMETTPDGRAGVLHAMDTLGRCEPDCAGDVAEGTDHRDERDQATVLLIDDTAAEDGWLLALRTGLPETLVHHFAFKGVHDAAEVCRLARVRNAVLLDLRLPAASGATPYEEVGFELLRRLRRDAPHVPIVVLSADEDVFRTRRCLEAGAVAYFPKTWRRLPSGLDRDWADPGFYEQYYQRLCAYLARALDGPPAVLALFKAQCSRLSRHRRYRAVVDGDGLAASIERLSDFVERLAWLHLDAHRMWLYRRLVREPDAWVRKSERAPALVETAVCLSGLVEDLLRRIILTHPRTKDADVERAALGTLIEISGAVLNPSIRSALRRMAEFRNAIVYRRRPADLGELGRQLDLSESLQLAIDLLPPLCDLVVEQQTSPRGAPSPAADFAPRLGEMVDATFGAAGPAANRRSANDYVRRRRALESSLRETEATLRVARQFETKTNVAAEAARNELEQLRKERDERLTAAVMSGGRRGVQTVEDYFKSKIAAAEECVRAAETSLENRAQIARAADHAANDARRRFREHLEAPPPLPDKSAHRRWAVLREWLTEFSLEERVARTLEEAPGSCCWDGEALSRDVEDIVAALSGACGHDPLSVWNGLRAWIEGASVSDAVTAYAPATASLDRRRSACESADVATPGSCAGSSSPSYSANTDEDGKSRSAGADRKGD